MKRKINFQIKIIHYEGNEFSENHFSIFINIILKRGIIMKIEKRNENYYLINGENEIEVNEITKDGKSLILPENESGRKFFALSKFEKSEIHDLNPINRSENHESIRKMTEIKFPKSHLEIHEKLNDEETEILMNFEESMKIYQEMMEKAYERLNPKKEMTEKEKLESKIEKLKRQLEELMNQ